MILTLLVLVQPGKIRKKKKEKFSRFFSVAIAEAEEAESKIAASQFFNDSHKNHFSLCRLELATLITVCNISGGTAG